MPRVLNAGEWVREGRGSELQFFALDDELDQWISEVLPPAFEPYVLFTSDMVRVGRVFEEKVIRCSGLSIKEAKSGTDRSSFWIASLTISPAAGDIRHPREFTTNGFILVQ